MEKEEVIDSIDHAIQCISLYRLDRKLKVLKLKSFSKKSTLNENLSKKGLKKIASDDSSILDKSIELIKEAYLVGQSGQPCPRCGGTGRI